MDTSEEEEQIDLGSVIAELKSVDAEIAKARDSFTDSLKKLRTEDVSITVALAEFIKLMEDI